MEEKAPFFDMPSGKEKDVNYPAQYMHAPHPKAGPTNEKAKRCPTAEEVYKGIYYK